MMLIIYFSRGLDNILLNYNFKEVTTLVYLITYELRKEDKDYNYLYEKIKSLGEWQRPLESTWFLDSELPISEIKRELENFMDGGDKLFISKITEDYDGCLIGSMWLWLSSHV